MFISNSSRLPPNDSAQRGQSIVIIAFMLVGLIAIAALVFDGGTAYAQRRRMQNAADAGSIAGARQLALGGSDSQVNSKIQEYTVTRNSANSYVATYYPGGQAVGGGLIPSGARGILVTAQSTFNTYFANLIGNPIGSVSADAYANFGGLDAPTQVQPLTRKCDEPSLAECGFVIGTQYDLWEGGGSGNFGWLGWNGDTDAGNIEDELRQDYSITDYDDPHDICASVAANCWIQGASGVNNSSGINDQLALWANVGATGTPMIITIFDTSEGSGANTNYHIVGFAAFVLTSYDLSGKHIYGSFVQWTTSGSICDSCPVTGLWGVHLSSPPAGTSTPAATSTSAPTSTSTPTNTPAGPTSTPTLVPTSTRTLTPIPTNTPGGPTSTPTSTPTRTSTPTSTSTPTITPTPCATPSTTTMSGSRNGQNVSLSWASVSGATNYKVYRSTTGPGGSFSLLDTVFGTTDNDTIPSNSTYSYYVTAIDSCGTGAASNVVTITR
ncbi:MAG: hypothetical protein HY327_06600 [Chloroflexi bacterium]|nr:hypothetical protein [Chloroflexota bacterium]